MKLRSAMVVDDNPDIRTLLMQALELEGYRVHVAENGEEAQRRLTEAEDSPCVLFLDLMMPVMDGRTFLQWKNQEPRYADIPVVVISAMAPDEQLPGAKAYLRKPIDLDDIFRVAKRFCG